VQSAHLGRLLRPEFVKTYHTPLCSDALCGFVKEFEEASEHNREVAAATHVLLAEQIPKFTRELPLLVREAVRQGLRLENFRLTRRCTARASTRATWACCGGT